MNLVIIGVGKVGETLVKNLSNENHDIVVVDLNPQKVEMLVNRYDVKGIVGGGVERTVLNDAGVSSADFVITCTSRDEMNILCSVLAKKMGAKRTIARVRDPEYFKEVDNMRSVLGLDYAFNPELATAKEIAHVLKFPSANNVESFGDGKATMVELDILNGNPVIGKSLRQISSEYGSKVLFVVVQRGDKVLIPRGDFIMEEGDTVHVIGEEAEIASFSKKLKIFKPRAKSVFIIGGGKIAYYLAEELLSAGVKVKIVENKPQRAEELSSLLDKATILLGDGTDHELLDEESLKDSDACITLTGMDEENVIVSLYAKQRGVDKVVTKVDRASVMNMVRSLGLDTVVSPRNVIANDIIRFVRTHRAETDGGINSFYKLHDKIEAVELTVGENFSAKGKALKNIDIKRGALIGGIIRGRDFILPGGDSTLEVGDRVVVISESNDITEIQEIIR